MPIASAQDAGQVCQDAVINQALEESEVAKDQEQLRKIQGLLNVYGYGDLVTDGRKGPATLEAFRRLCVDFKLISTENLAPQLISRLELTAAVSEKYPEWRQLIQSDEFKSWLKPQSKAEQERISTTLQTGPAEQVIAILDAYAGAEPEQAPASTPAPAPAPAPVPAKKKCEYSPAPVAGPAVFYRWQPDKEESEGDEENGGQECEEVKLPDHVLKGLDAIEGVAYPNKLLFQCALATSLNGSKCDLRLQEQTQLQIFQQAQNLPEKKWEKIQLSGGGCGCSRDFSSKVIGFYPFWLATGKQQQVNFSLFDRIGFYALTANKQGIIQNFPKWSDAVDIAAFINKAHKYRVEVDLTIYVSDWQKWADDEAINAAAKSVVQEVTQKFHSSQTMDLRAFFPFLEDTSSVTADGVTLVFDNYTSPDMSEKIVSIVTGVAKALDEAGSDAILNIMLGLDMNTIENQLREKQPVEKPSLFGGLSSILLDNNERSDTIQACGEQDEKENGKSLIKYIFVHLQEPTTKSKKTLRRKISNDFTGCARKTVLRKVVPIIAPSGHVKDPDGAFSQFNDDLIYFQDNFAGVGLWPLPLVSDDEKVTIVSDDEMGEIEKIIIMQYEEKNGTNFLGGLLDAYAPWLCEFACPHRWLFRIADDLLAGVLLVYALAAIWICKLRSLFRQYFLYFLAVGLAAVLIFLISMACDPYWQEREDAVLLTVFLVALVITIWRYISKETQPPLP
jgi:hypothetical protein